MMNQLDDGAPLTFWDEWARLGRVRDLANDVNSIDGDCGDCDVSWHVTIEVVFDPLTGLLGCGQFCWPEGVHDDLLDGADCVPRLDVLRGWRRF